MSGRMNSHFTPVASPEARGGVLGAILGFAGQAGRQAGSGLTIRRLVGELT
jgi:hypothetical protein